VIVGKRITTRAPSTRKPRKPKTQIRINKDIGTGFENEMVRYFTEYLRKREVKGIVYRYPDGKYDQKIDIIIDSMDFGFAGCECKSIKNSLENDGKIYFSTISSVSKKNGLHQFVNQHTYLFAGSRYGLFAIKFRDMQKIIIIPHQVMYEKIINGDLYITTEEIITNGFDISDEKASLKLYIRNKCKTVDT